MNQGLVSLTGEAPTNNDLFAQRKQYKISQVYLSCHWFYEFLSENISPSGPESVIHRPILRDFLHIQRGRRSFE